MVIFGQLIVAFIKFCCGAFARHWLIELSKIFIIAVCILVVAIPEGLPLAVSIAMALSVDRLKSDKILIKNMQAVQTCAMLHEICVAKTGTLTTGLMRVVKFAIGDALSTSHHEQGMDSVSNLENVDAGLLETIL